METKIDLTEDTSLRDMQRIAPNLVGHPAFEAIAAARKAIRERFPEGAINRLDVVSRSGLKEPEIISRLKKLLLLDEDFFEDLNNTASISATMNYGNCGLFATYGLSFFRINHPNILTENLYFYNHQAILVGRNPSTVENSYETWNEDTIVCDLWADKYYFISELAQYRTSANNIPFCAIFMPVPEQKITHANDITLCSDYSNEQISILGLSSGHYLTGNPRASIDCHDEEYKRDIIEWFEKDTICRAASKSSQLLRSFSMLTVNSSLSKKEVIDYLENVTAVTGWKYKNGKGGRICADMNEVNNIAAILRETGAMKVMGGYNKKEQCQINISDINVSIIRLQQSSSCTMKLS